MKRVKIFISSVQSEFAEEREMLSHYIRTDVLLGKFFEPLIFEEVPANEYSATHVYLKEVELCDIYLGLYGNLYGYEDEEGVSPTEREYDLAASLHKSRLIYIKSIDEDKRHPKGTALIKKVERDIVRKTFVDMDDLRTSVYASLVRYLEEREYIRWRPFDASFDNGATIEDLDEEKIRRFVQVARSKRSFPLTVDTPIEDFRVVIWRTGGQQSDPEVIQSDPDVVRLMELIKSNPSISRAELSRRLGLSERQTRKIIDRLRADGILSRKGGDYSGKWIIIGQQHG